MKSRIVMASLCAAMIYGLAACAPADETQTSDQTPASASEHLDLPDKLIERADYSNPNLWLCKADRTDDACDVPLDYTVISSSGELTEEKFVAAQDPAIDCFFVYPTVSLDTGYLSDWEPDAMELDDVALQFARFGSVCRTFAPLYRQFTLTALRAASGGPAPEGERPPATLGGIQDVTDAFNWYLEHENNGRGFVLIGHSQGAGLVRRLIETEIDGKPVQSQMVSAMMLGTAVMVPPGEDVGGSFKSVPLCRSEDQTGCAISYATFRDTKPPPAESRFGRGANGMRAACTNPANLASGAQAVSDPYFLTKGFLNGSGGTEQPDWTNPPQDITTPFVSTPGLVSLECVESGDFNYLAMHVNADPSDPRTDELAGEIMRATGPDLTWGLHLVDTDVAMGDMLRIVAKQAAAHAQ